MQLSNKITTAFVYQLKCGKYFKNHNKGSWSVSLNGVSKRDITTNSLQNATHFKERGDDNPPYLASFMLGGKWLKINIKTIIEVEEEDDGNKNND